MPFALALLLVPIAAFASERISLEGAKKYAVDNNLVVQALRQEVAEREAVSGLARAPFLPTIGVAGGAEHRSGVSATLGYAYANLNLFNGLADRNRAQIADIEEHSARIRLKQEEFRVALEVEEQFQYYLLKRVSVDLKKRALDLNRAHREMASRRQSAGMAASSDVMEFDLRESLLQSDIQLMQQEIEETRLRFRRLLGDVTGTNFEPTGSLEHQHLRASLPDLLKAARENGSQIRLASREVAKAELESGQWKAAWLPRLDLETQAGYLSIDDRPADGSASVRAAAVARFDLFNGLRSSYERAEGAAKLLKAQAQLQGAILEATEGVEATYSRLSTIQSRVDIESKNKERAEKYYNAVLGEYRRGVKNSADVKAAAEGMFEAKLRSESFKYEFLKQRIDLEKILGAPIEVEKIKEG